ncbi:disulfide bond formation protein B [Phytopseudomonas dryadis]|uniref:Disulfide bond formation protein B n=1 Tax=Phytopseudomonas dryadis TaxID=2487520 RepID=A0A4Q9R9U3_9GAMM|nr:disulfide bond formation protein B [Pseudomonas dryadis]TBU97473.1 disulfide bond formation protein B [Pseudomonas dryadis]
MSRFATPATLLLLIALACVAMLGGALVAQHLFGWEPCTLCVQIRLWLALAALLALLLSAASAARQTWLAFLAWPLLLAATGMALVDNAHVVLIELGIMESFSCSPFPFYYQWLPLHEYWPGVFMSGGVCGQNDYTILGLPFTLWTLLSIAALAALVLFSLWRSIRGKR